MKKLVLTALVASAMTFAVGCGKPAVHTDTPHDGTPPATLTETTPETTPAATPAADATPAAAPTEPPAETPAAAPAEGAPAPANP